MSLKMENTSCTKICRFCLESSDSNLEIIDEVTFSNLEFLWLKLNLSVSEKPVMCGECAKTIRNYSDFKTKCLEIENYIVLSVKDKNSTKVDLQEVYRSQMSFDDVVKVPEDHLVCRLCLELVKNDVAIFLRNGTNIVLKLEQYFPELDLTCTEDAVICEACQVSLQRYFSFINNCLTTEEKIMEYCKVEGTNIMGQIELNNVTHFISKGFLKSTFELGAVKIEGMCNEISDANYCVETKKEEILDIELNIKEDISAQETESKLTDENSFQHHLSPSQSDCEPQLKIEKPEICGYENTSSDRPQEHILAHKGTVPVPKYNREISSVKTKTKDHLRKTLLRHKHRNTSDILTRGTLYKCDQCNYETKWISTMKRHILAHKTTSEIAMHKCEKCAFETKRKCTLQEHMLVHKNESEVEMYKCVSCPFETKWKNVIRRHMLSHRNATDIAMRFNMHKCVLCDYEAERTVDLKVHMLSHKTLSEVTLYKCDQCDYESKWKCHLKRHMLTHKIPSEIVMYKCEACAYETKRKDCLQEHMLVHKDASEVEMHKCELCPFESKWKGVIRRHLLSHKKTTDVTDVAMQGTKCNLCGYEAQCKFNLQRHMLIHETPSESLSRNAACGATLLTDVYTRPKKLQGDPVQNLFLNIDNK